LYCMAVKVDEMLTMLAMFISIIGMVLESGSTPMAIATKGPLSMMQDMAVVYIHGRMEMCTGASLTKTSGKERYVSTKKWSDTEYA
jgi:hypothetical protein